MDKKGSRNSKKKIVTTADLPTAVTSSGSDGAGVDDDDYQEQRLTMPLLMTHLSKNTLFAESRDPLTIVDMRPDDVYLFLELLKLNDVYRISSIEIDYHSLQASDGTAIAEFLHSCAPAVFKYLRNLTFKQPVAVAFTAQSDVSPEFMKYKEINQFIQALLNKHLGAAQKFSIKLTEDHGALESSDKTTPPTKKRQLPAAPPDKTLLADPLHLTAAPQRDVTQTAFDSPKQSESIETKSPSQAQIPSRNSSCDSISDQIESSSSNFVTKLENEDDAPNDVGTPVKGVRTEFSTASIFETESGASQTSQNSTKPPVAVISTTETSQGKKSKKKKGKGATSAAGVVENPPATTTSSSADSKAKLEKIPISEQPLTSKEQYQLFDKRDFYKSQLVTAAVPTELIKNWDFSKTAIPRSHSRKIVAFCSGVDHLSYRSNLDWETSIPMDRLTNNLYVAEIGPDVDIHEYKFCTIKSAYLGLTQTFEWEKIFGNRGLPKKHQIDFVFPLFGHPTIAHAFISFIQYLFILEYSSIDEMENDVDSLIGAMINSRFMQDVPIQSNDLLKAIASAAKTSYQRELAVLILSSLTGRQPLQYWRYISQESLNMTVKMLVLSYGFHSRSLPRLRKLVSDVAFLKQQHFYQSTFWLPLVFAPEFDFDNPAIQNKFRYAGTLSSFSFAEILKDITLLKGVNYSRALIQLLDVAPRQRSMLSGLFSFMKTIFDDRVTPIFEFSHHLRNFLLSVAATDALNSLEDIFALFHEISPFSIFGIDNVAEILANPLVSCLRRRTAIASLPSLNKTIDLIQKFHPDVQQQCYLCLLTNLTKSNMFIDVINRLPALDALKMAGKFESILVEHFNFIYTERQFTKFRIQAFFDYCSSLRISHDVSELQNHLAGAFVTALLSCDPEELFASVNRIKAQFPLLSTKYQHVVVLMAKERIQSVKSLNSILERISGTASGENYRFSSFAASIVAQILTEVIPESLDIDSSAADEPDVIVRLLSAPKEFWFRLLNSISNSPEIRQCEPVRRAEQALQAFSTDLGKNRCFVSRIKRILESFSDGEISQLVAPDLGPLVARVRAGILKAESDRANITMFMELLRQTTRISDLMAHDSHLTTYFELKLGSSASISDLFSEKLHSELLKRVVSFSIEYNQFWRLHSFLNFFNDYLTKYCAAIPINPMIISPAASNPSALLDENTMDSLHRLFSEEGEIDGFDEVQRQASNEASATGPTAAATSQQIALQIAIEDVLPKVVAIYVEQISHLWKQNDMKYIDFCLLFGPPISIGNILTEELAVLNEFISHQMPIAGFPRILTAVVCDGLNFNTNLKRLADITVLRELLGFNFGKRLEATVLNMQTLTKDPECHLGDVSRSVNDFNAVFQEYKFHEEEWELISELSSALELLKIIRDKFLNEDLGILMDAVEDSSDSWIREDTVSNLLKIKRFLFTLLSPELAPTNLQGLATMIREMARLNKEDDFISKIQNCSTHLNGLVRLFDGLANRGELTKEIIASVMKKGQINFHIDNETKIPTVTVTYASSRSETRIYYTELQELRSRALLIANTDGQNDVQKQVSQLMATYVIFVDILQRIVETGIELNAILDLELKANEAAFSKLIPCTNDFAEVRSSLESHHSSLLTLASSYHDAFKQARDKFPFLNYFSPVQLWQLHVFFSSEHSIRQQKRDYIMSLLLLSNREIDEDRVIIMPTLPMHSFSSSVTASLTSLGEALQELLHPATPRLRRFRFDKSHEIDHNVATIAHEGVTVAIISHDVHLIPTVMSYYLNDEHLPEPTNLLFCDSSTNIEEVHLFLLRCCLQTINESRAEIFCIAAIEKLQPEIQELFLADLDTILSRDDVSPAFKLLIVCQDGELQQHLKDNLHRFGPSSTQGLLEPAMARTFRSHFPDCYCVASSVASVGKTSEIFERAAASRLRPRTIHLSGYVSRKSVVSDISSLKMRRCDCLHIDIYAVQNHFDLSVLLFEIIVLRRLKSAKSHCLIPSNVPIFIELSNNITGDLRQKVPILRFINPIELVFDWDRLVFSRDICSSEQIVCNYLNANAQDELLKTKDIVFTGKAKGRNALPAVPLEDERCCMLLSDVFKGKDNLSFGVVHAFLNVLALHLRDFSESAFFKVSNLRGMVNDRSQCSRIRKDLFTQLLSVSLDFAIRCVGQSKSSQRASWLDDMGLVMKDLPSFSQSNHLIVAFQTASRSSISIFYIDQSKIVQEKEAITRLWNLQVKSPLPDYTKLDSDALLGHLEKLVCVRGLLQSAPRNYALAIDNLVKMCLIVIRTRSQVPVVIMGSTGCGKTSLIRFLSQISGTHLDILNIHAGTSIESISKFVEDAEKWLVANPNQRIWLFFDEINTSIHIGLLADIICHRRLHGRSLSDRISLLSACNPYQKKSKNTSLVTAGLASLTTNKDPLSSLVYRVEPLPECLLDFVWDYGTLRNEEEAFYVANMIQYNDKRQLRPLRVMATRCVLTSQKFIRSCEEDSSVSLRDVNRCVLLFDWFRKNLSFLSADKEWDLVGFVRTHHKKELRAWILALAHCYYCRLSTPESRLKYRRHIAGLIACEFSCGNFTEKHFKQVISVEQRAYVDNMELPEGVACNASLMENIFVLSVCIFNRLPVFLVGKPGCSKSLAMQLIRSNYRGVDSKSPVLRRYPQVYVIAFQGSESSTSEGILTVFEKAHKYQEQNKDAVAVVLLDEVGLAEVSAQNPLKVLHALLEPPKVAVVGISNWALDAAKMNRAIHISRPDPDQDDLVQTAEAIQQGFVGSKFRLFTGELSSIARAYHKYYAEQPIQNFHGLRDYYSLVKALLRKGRRPDSSVMVELVNRNFGGIPDEFGSINVIRDIFLSELGLNTYLLDARPTSVHILQTIFDNLEDPMARHLMLISQGDRGLSVVQNYLREKNLRPEIIYGSQFEQDDSEQYRYRMLSQIILYMEAGKVLILKDLDSIYGSLYDMLNQNYSYVGGKRNCRIALGAHSNPMCYVHDDFHCIVLMEQSKLREAKSPLLNRFEKQLITYEHLLTPVRKDIIGSLTIWVKEFSHVAARDTSDTFNEYSCFADFSDSLLLSAVLKFHTEELTQKEVEDRCKRALIEIAFSDSMIRLKRSKLAMSNPNEISNWEKYYFNIDRPSDLQSLLASFTREPSGGASALSMGQQVIAYTFDTICENVSEIQSSTASGYLQFEKLSTFKSERSLTDRLKHFWSVSNTAGVLVVQCNVLIDSKCIAMCKYTIDRLREEYYVGSSAQLPMLKHVVLVMHLNRERHTLLRDREDWQFDFLCGWRMISIDTVRPSEASVRDLQELTVDQILTTVSSMSFRKVLKSVLMWCFTCIKYPIAGSVVVNHIKTLFSKITADASLQRLFEDLIINFLKSQPEPDWQVEIACDRRLLRLNSTFLGALCEYIYDRVRQPLAKIIFMLETQCALTTYFSILSTGGGLLDYWFDYCRNPELFDFRSIKQHANGAECYVLDPKHKLLNLKLPFIMAILTSIDDVVKYRLSPILQCDDLEDKEVKKNAISASRDILIDTFRDRCSRSQYDQMFELYLHDFVTIKLGSITDCPTCFEPLLASRFSQEFPSKLHPIDLHIEWHKKREEIEAHASILILSFEDVTPNSLEGLYVEISASSPDDIGTIILNFVGEKLIRDLTIINNTEQVRQWSRKALSIGSKTFFAKAQQSTLTHALRVCTDFHNLILWPTDNEHSVAMVFEKIRSIPTAIIQAEFQIDSEAVIQSLASLITWFQQLENSSMFSKESGTLFYNSFLHRCLAACDQIDTGLLRIVLSKLTNENLVLNPASIIVKILSNLDMADDFKDLIVHSDQIMPDELNCINEWLASLGSKDHELSVLFCDVLESTYLITFDGDFDNEDSNITWSHAVELIKSEAASGDAPPLDMVQPLSLLCSIAYIRLFIKSAAITLSEDQDIPAGLRTNLAMLSDPQPRLYALRVYLAKQIRQLGFTMDEVRAIARRRAELPELKWLVDLPWACELPSPEQILGYDSFAFQRDQTDLWKLADRLLQATERAIIGQGDKDLRALLDSNSEDLCASLLFMSYSRFYLAYQTAPHIFGGEERVLQLIDRSLPRRFDGRSIQIISGLLTNDFGMLSELQLNGEGTHMKSVMTHYLIYLLTSGRNSPLAAYMHNPKAAEGSMVLTSLPDNFATIIKQVATENGGQIGLYACPNGHRYLIGNCTNPNYISRCNECKAEIGGMGHNLLPGNTRIAVHSAATMTGLENLPGYYIASDAQMASLEFTPSQLSSQGFRILNFFVDCSILFGISFSRGFLIDDYQKLIKGIPVVSDLSAMMQKHIESNWNVLRRKYNASEEEMGILFHSVLGYLSQCQDLSSTGLLGTPDARSQWELQFERKCMNSIFTDQAKSIQEFRVKSLEKFHGGSVIVHVEKEIDELDAEDIGQNREKRDERLSYYLRNRIDFAAEPDDRISDMFRSAFHHLSEPDRKVRFAFINLLLESEQDNYALLQYLAPVLEWVSFVRSQFKRKVTRSDVAQLSNAQFLYSPEFEGQTPEAAGLFAKFCTAWNTLKGLVTQYECEVLPPLPEMSGDSSIMLSVLERRDNGIFLYGIFTLLTELQNSFMTKVTQTFAEGLRALKFLQTDPDQVAVASVDIMRLQEHQILHVAWSIDSPYVRTDHRYGHGTKAYFDFEKIQNELAVKLLQNAVHISMDSIPKTFPFLFEQFLEDMTFLDHIRDSVTQIALLPEARRRLQENKYIQPNEAIKVLDVILYFVKRLQPSPEMTIDQFCRSVLPADEAETLRRTEILSYQVTHLVAIYEEVESLASKHTVELTPDVFKVPLTDTIKTEIVQYITAQFSSLGESRLVSTITALNRYMFRFLSSTLEDGKCDLPLGQYLMCCWPVLDERDDIVECLPASVLFKHAYATRRFLMDQLQFIQQKRSSDARSSAYNRTSTVNDPRVVAKTRPRKKANKFDSYA